MIFKIFNMVQILHLVLHICECSVIYSQSLKLLARSLYIGFCIHLSTKIRYKRYHSLLEIHIQYFELKRRHVPLIHDQIYRQLCGFGKRAQVREHYGLTTKQVKFNVKYTNLPILMSTYNFVHS